MKERKKERKKEREREREKMSLDNELDVNRVSCDDSDAFPFSAQF